MVSNTLMANDHWISIIHDLFYSKYVGSSNQHIP